MGLVAPVDVVVPPGNTGLDPSQTSFFQVKCASSVRHSTTYPIILIIVFT